MAPTVWSYALMALAEREEISRGLATALSMRHVAAGFGWSPSTISLEVAANGGRHYYRACDAEASALRRARRPRPAKLARCPKLRRVVEAKLEKRWSPQQIADSLPEAFPHNPDMRVSLDHLHVAVRPGRGALRQELFRCLRQVGPCAAPRESAKRPVRARSCYM